MILLIVSHWGSYRLSGAHFGLTVGHWDKVGVIMGQWRSLLVGGVQWDSVRKEKEQIYFDGLMENYTLIPLKKLLHKKLKSFP